MQPCKRRMDGEQLVAHESELYGVPLAGGSTRFGYSWRRRTFGLGAVKIQSVKLGIRSVDVLATCEVNHLPTFTDRFVASSTAHWFKLMKGEELTAIHFRESETHDHITSLRFETNKRRSQWFGSCNGTLRKTEAPAGFYIASIRGACQGNACRNLGAYFVPVALRADTPMTATWVGDSKVLGDVAYDTTSREYAFCPAPTTGAIVVTIVKQLMEAVMLSPVAFHRYLAVTDDRLEEGGHVLAFAEGELITALRVCVTHGRISAVQLETTLRTTEWFGSLPGPDAVIQVRSIADELKATHIGGIVMMRGAGHIKSIGAKFYKQAGRA